jgi:L-ascorbate metabolism protein UlaG (beta-lactamase superfamily)
MQGRKPESIAADASYGNGEFLQWLMDREIKPYMPTRDAVGRTRSLLYGPEYFTYLPDRNSYICPSGQQLNYGGRNGALVRTPSASFRFDFVPGIGTEGFALSKEWLKRLVAQSDGHFISHWHPDHANPDVARLFMEAKKPVVAPERLFAEEPTLSHYLTVPERSVHAEHTIPVQGGKSRLNVITFPGHQGRPVLDNVTLVRSVEGYSVLHTGDQSGDEGEGTDFDWLAQIGHYQQVDVLLTNGWTNDLHRIVRGVNPCLVIAWSRERDDSCGSTPRRVHAGLRTHVWSPLSLHRHGVGGELSL